MNLDSYFGSDHELMIKKDVILIILAVLIIVATALLR